MVDRFLYNLQKIYQDLPWDPRSSCFGNPGNIKAPALGTLGTPKLLLWELREHQSSSFGNIINRKLEFPLPQNPEVHLPQLAGCLGKNRPLMQTCEFEVNRNSSYRPSIIYRLL